MINEFNPYEEKMIYHTIGDKKTLKVGIISDSQIITSSKKEDQWLKIFSDHLKKALEVLKSHKIEVLIFAGDLVDGGTEYAYDEILSIYNSVYKTEEEKPIFNYIMGNHDYWLSYMENGKFSPKIGDSKELQFLFFKKMKEKPFSHKVINGYHFINWGSENGSLDDPNPNIDWVENEIKLALEDDNNKNKPIFVTTHFAAQHTVYGSDDWGTKSIKTVLQYILVDIVILVYQMKEVYGKKNLLLYKHNLFLIQNQRRVLRMGLILAMNMGIYKLLVKIIWD